MNVRKKSQKQEKEVAKSFKGSLTAASGAMWYSKGDVRTDKYLIECKTTEKPYYSLSATTWEKISQEADRDGMRIPLMMIDLEDEHRVVVFNPIDFGVSPVDLCSGKYKSVRITRDELGLDDMGNYSFMKCVAICGKKRNLLSYMLLEDFVDAYGKE